MIQKICHFILFSLLGWKVIGPVPTVPKYIFSAVAHTSNWDFVYAWLAVRALGLDVTIFAKDEYYRWPFKTICRFFGVAPVNRRERTNFVDAVAQQFNECQQLAVLITPEGTRSHRSELKSGYYYLARQAGVPIVLAGPNYQQKTITFMPPRAPLATFEEDQQQVVEFSQAMRARHSENTF